MVAEFDIRVIDESQMIIIRKQMMERYGVKVDDMLVVEGCLNDDKTVLGGKHEFLSHFCTFFNFNICFSAAESKPINTL